MASAELVEEKRLSRELSAQVQDFTEGACADDTFHALPGWPEVISPTVPSVHPGMKEKRDTRHLWLSKQKLTNGERSVQAVHRQTGSKEGLRQQLHRAHTELLLLKGCHLTLTLRCR